MGIIIFNGKSSLEYGLQVEHYPSYEAPQRDYELTHVPGRNGDVLVDSGSYKNVNREYELASGSCSPDTFTFLVQQFIDWLCSFPGYGILEDSYDDDHYRVAVYDESLSITNIQNRAGRAKIRFNCKPQRFLKTGDVPIILEEPGFIENKTRFASRPVLTVSGNGKTKLFIGQKAIDIAFTDVSSDGTDGFQAVLVSPEEFLEKVSELSYTNYIFNNSGKSVNIVPLISEESTLEVDPITEEGVRTFIERISGNVQDSIFLYYTVTTFEVQNLKSSYVTKITATSASKAAIDRAYSADTNVIFTTNSVYLEVADVTGGIDISSISLNNFIEKINYYISINGVSSPYSEDNNVKAIFSKYNNNLYLRFIYTNEKGDIVQTEDDVIEELSDFGIAYSGSFVNGNSFSIIITTTWMDERQQEYDGCPFGLYCDELPNTKTSFRLDIVKSSWRYNGDKVLLSEFGIETKGTPVSGDRLYCELFDTWQSDQIEGQINLKDYGFTFVGIPDESSIVSVSTSGTITIDCELQESYNNTKNMNRYVSFVNGIPQLEPGNNDISFDDHITSLEVVPKWWTI